MQRIQKRQIWSLAISFVMALLVMCAIVWILRIVPNGDGAEDAQADSTPSSEDESDDESEEEVLIELAQLDSLENPLDPPPVPTPAVEEDVVPETGDGMDLSTDSQGGAEANEPDSVLNTSEEPPSDATEEPAETDPPTDANSVVDQSLPDSPTSDAPMTDPVSTDEDVASTQAAVEGTGFGDFQGVLPPLVYTGDVSTLFERFPRLEAVWVYDTDAASDGRRRVLLEAVIDRRGELFWRNERTGERSTGFELTVMRYHADGLVHMAKPTELQLWKHRSAIARHVGLPDPDASRFGWGYYRHRAEAALLKPVRLAYQSAVQMGTVEFDSTQGDRLEVLWGRDDNDLPRVVAVRFLPEQGDPVDLTIP